MALRAGFFQGALAVVAAGVLLMLENDPDDVVSRVSEWYALARRAIGQMPAPPDWLAKPAVDTVVFWLALSMLALSASWFLWSKVSTASRSSKDDWRGLVPISAANTPSRPDMPFIEAFGYLHVHPQFGPARGAKTVFGHILAEPDTLKLLRDAARRGQLSVWGCKEISRIKNAETGNYISEFASAVEAIPREHWITHEMENRGFEHTEMRGRSILRAPGNLLLPQEPTYGLLQFSERQVRTLWPSASSSVTEVEGFAPDRL